MHTIYLNINVFFLQYKVSHQISPNVGDGSFAYRSVMSDGLESESQGHFANPIQSQVHQGSYTTMDEHGQVVRVDYVADKSIISSSLLLTFALLPNCLDLFILFCY